MKRIIVLVIVIAIIVLVTSFLMMYKNNKQRNNNYTNNESNIQSNILEDNSTEYDIGKSEIVEQNIDVTEEKSLSGENNVNKETESADKTYFSYVYDDSLEDGCYALSITLKEDNHGVLSNGKGISFYGVYKIEDDGLSLVLKSIGDENSESNNEIAQIRFTEINDNTLEITNCNILKADGLSDIFAGMIFEKDIIL